MSRLDSLAGRITTALLLLGIILMVTPRRAGADPNNANCKPNRSACTTNQQCCSSACIAGLCGTPTTTTSTTTTTKSSTTTTTHRFVDNGEWTDRNSLTGQ